MLAVPPQYVLRVLSHIHINAWASGVKLIQPEFIGNAKRAQTNLVVALSSPNGVINPANGQGFGQMPAEGPFLMDVAPNQISPIVECINSKCPD